MAATADEPSYTRTEVTTALNDAVDDILDALGHKGCDGLNLLVNTALTYLDNPTADLRDAVEDNYGDTYTEVLGWTASACR